MEIQTKIINKLNTSLVHFGYFLEDVALDTKLIGGDNYQKFIVLCRGRVGSNFLVDLLSSHTQILAFNELFHWTSIIWGYEYPSYRKSPKIFSLRENEPTKFLDELVFRRYPKSVSAVGFKFTYDHAEEERCQPVLDYLQEISNLKVIHLKRKNILKAYLSYKVASSTGVWISKSSKENVTDLSVELDYEDCLRAFRETQSREKKYDDFFSNHRKIDVFYENLSSNTIEVAKEIHDFLGVKREIPRSSTKKIIQKPLSQMISNYYSLKEKFENTSWIEFFEE